MTNGVKQVGGGATVVAERFESPRPAFQAPQNADYMTVAPKDNTPAKTLQKAKEDGNEKMAVFFAKAEESAKRAAEVAAAKREGRKLPSSHTKRSSKKSEPIVTIQVGHFTPEDVVDDRTFIIRTRSGDYHTDEMKRLFWANGGEAYMKAGLSYASAFSNLRNDKQRSLNQKK